MSDQRDYPGADEMERMKRDLIDAVSQVLNGTIYSPPDGGVLVEAVLVGVWLHPNGDKGLAFFPATNHFWSTLGMLRDAYRRHERTGDEAENWNDE